MKSLRYGHILLWALAFLGSGAAMAQYGLDAPMDEAVARALLNRFGYGATPAMLNESVGTTPRRYIERALGQGSRLPAPVQETLAALPVMSMPVERAWSRWGPGGTERDKAARSAESRMQLQQAEREYLVGAVQARLLTMANSDNPGHEVLLSFWLNHFSVFAPKGPVKLVAWDYVQALDRVLPQDSFEALLRASFYSPAMQLYLDNAQSTAPDSMAARQAVRHGKPAGLNENLARELLELHTLGVGGGYTQQDVQALARIISGAGVYSPRMQDRRLAQAGARRMGLFLFDPRRHDDGTKSFLGQTFPAEQGMAEIDRALHLMATHPATARHVALKLARRFLADEPPEPVVRAMSQAFLDSGGRISATLWPLMQAPEFGASLARRGKFKEPIDYLLSVARAACGDQPIANGPLLLASLRGMGQAPLLRTTPDGYGAQEADWLSPAAMAQRVRLALGVAAGRVPLALGGDAAGTDAAPRPGRGTACELDPAALERAVGPLDEGTQAAAASLSPRERVALWLASPEFMRR